MKTRFQIFKAPFYFVGWQAPAYRDIQSQRDHERLKGFKEKSLLLISLEPFFMPIKARFQVNWSLHLICDASVENLYEETATTNR